MFLAGTGHRPQKIFTTKSRNLALLTQFARYQLIDYGASHVISGMAQGWDMALAIAALELGLPLHAYIFAEQEAKWPPKTIEMYRKVLSQAEYVQPYGDVYAIQHIHARNRGMVDDGEVLLALWDGTPGGTASTVGYANETGRIVANCWDEWIAMCEDIEGETNGV